MTPTPCPTVPFSPMLLRVWRRNDIEKNKLAQYKNKVALIESEQAKLAEVRKQAIIINAADSADAINRSAELDRRLADLYQKKVAALAERDDIREFEGRVI